MVKRFCVSWEERHQDQKHSYNADESEALAFLNGQSQLESGMNDERIADALDDETPTPKELGMGDGLEGWHESDIVLDEVAGRIRGHIERRLQLLGDAYPFTLDRNTLVYKPSRFRVYEFFLICSNLHTIPQFTRYATELQRLFEKVCCSVFGKFVGMSCQSEHVGWPRDDGLQRFKQLVERMHERTGEFVWSPESYLVDDPSPKFIKDCGVDFVVWKEPPEQGLGSIFFLGQCATGRDWVDKTNDINLKELNSWIRPLSYVDPVSVFAMPYIITDVFIQSVSKSSGFVLDRLRASLVAAEEGIGSLEGADEERYYQLADPETYY